LRKLKPWEEILIWILLAILAASGTVGDLAALVGGGLGRMPMANLPDLL